MKASRRHGTTFNEPLGFATAPCKEEAGEWGLCGEFKLLNAVIRPDRYPVSYLHDFYNNLQSNTVLAVIY